MRKLPQTEDFYFTTLTIFPDALLPKKNNVKMLLNKTK